MEEAENWRGIDPSLAVGAAVIVAYGVLVLDWSAFVVIALFWFENVSKSNSGTGQSQLLPVHRFIISREDDATRP